MRERERERERERREREREEGQRKLRTHHNECVTFASFAHFYSLLFLIFFFAIRSHKEMATDEPHRS